MTALVRKAVLLRFDPELLARADVCRGAMTRQEWMVAAVEFACGEVEAGWEPVPETHMLAGTMMSPARPITDVDEGPLGLEASRGADGALEISAADAATSTPQGAIGLEAGAAALPDPLAESEAPDTGSATLVEEEH